MLEANFYPNPLDNFRSYSYHFILTVSSTTEAFRKQIGSESSKPLYSLVDNVKIGESIDLGNRDVAYLLVDTRRFSQYSITKFEAEYVYGTGDRANPSVPISTLKMELIDTTGLTFFNLLMDIFRNKIQSTRFSAFFLLNVMFVGHNDDGSTEIISTTYIPLILLLMGANVTSSGTTYDMEFVETEGGARRGSSAQVINHLGATQALRTPENDNTLGGMIQSLENLLNQRSVEFYQTYINNTGPNESTGKLVQYMINLPENINGQDWRRFQLSTLARSKNVEAKFLDTAKTQTLAAGQKEKIVKEAAKVVSNNGRYSQITFSPNTTVTDAIKEILESCNELYELGSRERRNAGNAILYKVLTNITADATSYLIHFDVYPYYAPKLDEHGRVIVGGPKGANRAGNEVMNTIEYDYIFTGRNSHIERLDITYMPESVLALDMNLEMGGDRFAQTSGVAGNSRQLMNGASKTARKADDSTAMIRPGDPIFPTTKTLINSSNNSSQVTEELPYDQAIKLAKQKQEFNQTMAYMHFLSSIQIDMTIRGNSNLLRKYADRSSRGGVPPHSNGGLISPEQIKNFKSLNADTRAANFRTTVSANLISARDYYKNFYYRPKVNSSFKKAGSEDTLDNGIDIATMPVFVKLNIKTPNVDYDGEFIDARELYTNGLFFKDHYQILTVKHSFVGGKFEQHLTLIPYAISSGAPTKEDKESVVTHSTTKGTIVQDGGSKKKPTTTTTTLPPSYTPETDTTQISATPAA